MTTHENHENHIDATEQPGQNPGQSPATDRRAVVRQIAELGRALRHLRHHGSGPRAAWHDPSQGQGRVLSLLRLQPETTQRELTYLMGMSRQALAELLAKLEAKGLVEREASTTDRRVVVVRLTDAGREVQQQARAAAEPADLLEVLSDDEVAQLTELLGRVHTRVHTELGAKVAARGGRPGPGGHRGAGGPRGPRPGLEDRGPRGERGGRGMPGRPGRGDRTDLPGFEEFRAFRAMAAQRRASRFGGC